MELSGKVVLVTGGGGGIGAGIAEAFVEKGAKVAITDINADYADRRGRSHWPRHDCAPAGRDLAR